MGDTTRDFTDNSGAASNTYSDNRTDRPSETFVDLGALLSSYGKGGTSQISITTTKLGEGAHAEVFAGWMVSETGAKEEVAIKRLKPSAHHDGSEAMKMFLREVHTMLDLQKQGCHPCLLALLGGAAEPGVSMIALELMREGDVKTALRRDRVTLEDKWTMLSDVASGCEYIHSMQFMHRDLKPSNVLTTSRHYKICDFGVSVNVNDPQAYHTRCGTHHYMASEVLMGSANTLASDVFSFGVYAWEVVTRRLPFDGHRRENFCAPVGDWTVDNGRSAEDLWGEALVNTLEACMNPEASERPSWTEVLGALQACRDVVLERGAEGGIGWEPPREAAGATSTTGTEITNATVNSTDVGSTGARAGSSAVSRESRTLSSAASGTSTGTEVMDERKKHMEIQENKRFENFSENGGMTQQMTDVSNQVSNQSAMASDYAPRMDKQRPATSQNTLVTFVTTTLNRMVRAVSSLTGTGKKEATSAAAPALMNEEPAGRATDASTNASAVVGGDLGAMGVAEPQMEMDDEVQHKVFSRSSSITKGIDDRAMDYSATSEATESTETKAIVSGKGAKAFKIADSGGADGAPTRNRVDREKAAREAELAALRQQAEQLKREEEERKRTRTKSGSARGGSPPSGSTHKGGAGGSMSGGGRRVSQGTPNKRLKHRGRGGRPPEQGRHNRRSIDSRFEAEDGEYDGAMEGGNRGKGSGGGESSQEEEGVENDGHEDPEANISTVQSSGEGVLSRSEKIGDKGKKEDKPKPDGEAPRRPAKFYGTTPKAPAAAAAAAAVGGVVIPKLHDNAGRSGGPAKASAITPSSNTGGTPVPTQSPSSSVPRSDNKNMNSPAKGAPVAKPSSMAGPPMEPPPTRDRDGGAEPAATTATITTAAAVTTPPSEVGVMPPVLLAQQQQPKGMSPQQPRASSPPRRKTETDVPGGDSPTNAPEGEGGASPRELSLLGAASNDLPAADFEPASPPHAGPPVPPPPAATAPVPTSTSVPPPMPRSVPVTAPVTAPVIAPSSRLEEVPNDERCRVMAVVSNAPVGAVDVKIHVTNVANGGAVVSWEAPNAPAGATWKLSMGPAGKPQRLQYAGPLTSFTAAGLSAGVTYNAKVALVGSPSQASMDFTMPQ